MKNLLETRVQLNGYEAVPYFLQSSHWIVCWFLCFLPIFTNFCMIWSWYYSANQNKTILWSLYAKTGFKLVKTGKNIEIKKQSYLKFWINWIKFGAVSYLLSCTSKCFGHNWKPCIWEVRTSQSHISRGLPIVRLLI